MATTSYKISGRAVHGSGVANCGSYPTIKVTLTLTFSRQPGSEEVTWTISDASWSHPTSGSYGFKFYCYLGINESNPNNLKNPINLLIKNNTTASSWWNSVTMNKTGSGTFVSTESSVSVDICVKGQNNCTTSGNWCFRTTPYTQVAHYRIGLPPYEALYSIDYDANGGTGAPESQQKTTTEDLVLTTDVPTFPLDINYYNGPSDTEPSETEIVNREFLSWNTDALGTGVSYQPGETYVNNESCTLYAQWGYALLTPQALPEKYVRVDLATNGGEVSPTYLTPALTPLGYGIDPLSSEVPYIPGTTYNISNSKDLYPKYGLAVLPLSAIPVPRRQGFIFDGWYTDPEFTDRITDALSTLTDTTIYAKWKPIAIHKFTDDNDWDNIPEYVWRFNGTEWQKVAPIYAFTGTSWKNLSENT